MTSPYGQVSVAPTGQSIHSFRNSGHSDKSAVGDLVDNCVDAGASKIQIDLDLKASREKSTLSIADNGCGMTAEQLAVALTLGPSGNRNSGDLGKFGLGMKFASVAIGRRMEVLSKVEGGVLVKGVYDIDVISNPKTEWGATIEKVEDRKTLSFFGKKAGKCGTIVKISNLDGMSSSSQQEFFKNVTPNLGLTYHRLIEGGTLSIEVNGTTVRPTSPMEPDFEARLKAKKLVGSRNHCRDEFVIKGMSFTFESVVLIAEAKVDISGRSKAADAPWREYLDLQPKQSNSGVYVFRNGRLIDHLPLTVFGHSSHPSQNYLRFEMSFGDELDEVFKVPNSKNSIEVNDLLKDVVSEHIRRRIKFVHSNYESKKVKDEDDKEDIDSAVEEIRKALARVQRDKNIEKLKGRGQKSKRKRGTGGKRRSKGSGTSSSRRTHGPLASIERAHLGRLGPLFDYSFDASNRIQMVINVDHAFYMRFIGVEQSNKSGLIKLFGTLLFSVIHSGEKQASKKDYMDQVMDELLTEMSRLSRLVAEKID